VEAWREHEQQRAASLHGARGWSRRGRVGARRALPAPPFLRSQIQSAVRRYVRSGASTGSGRRPRWRGVRTDPVVLRERVVLLGDGRRSWRLTALRNVVVEGQVPGVPRIPREG
jgi:hypothetical protein